MRIALVSEGTYPYAMGGVSVWCDQLIRGMPEHRWTMVPLCVDGTERSVFDQPANLDGVHPVALWKPYRQGRACRPGVDFRVAYRELAYAMLAPLQLGAQRAAAVGLRFLRALRRLHGYAAAGGDLRGALVSDDALRLLVDAWYDQRREDDLRLADAVTASSLIGHMLQPLALPPIRVDVVHAAMNGLSVLPGLVAKWRHTTPLVLSEHGIYLRERYLGYLSEPLTQAAKVVLLGFFRALAGAGYAAADVIAPHSRYNRRWQLQNGADPRRLWTMYNGVEVDDFPVAPTEPAEPTIVFMGRIDPLKDVHTLIRAFALVRAEIPAARLRIFGGTPRESLRYRDSCAELIDELNLGGAAVLEGRVDDPAEAYHQGHVVALTSISEGFPYTVVEAMACGRPVVCTNVGGVSEAVGEAGFVVPARDAPAIARALVTVLSDHDLRARLGTAARARVLAHFTLAQSLGEYRRVYDSLAGAGAGAGAAAPPMVAVPA